jgi:DNA gyrase/topoisomerase IV subunit A
MNEILKSNICSELGKNFINYATAVNGDRAIPDSRTGLKPVAQRILFIMERK